MEQFYSSNVYYARIFKGLIQPKPSKAQGRQEGANAIILRGLGLALDHGRGAGLAGAGGRRGADRGGRTLDLGAAGPGARGAFALGLIALGAIQYDWLGLRDG